MATLGTDVNRPNVPPEGATLSATVDVTPGEQTTGVERHVLLCLDTSGSMNGEKLEQAREGAAWVFGLLEDRDYVGIVAFDTDARVVMRPTRWGDTQRSVAMDRVEELGAGGGTDMYDGLDTARRTLGSLDHRAETARAVRRILLLSDGKDNARGPGDFAALAESIDDAGIRIEAAGIGTDYREETIRTLGETARGTWTHLESPGDIEAFFGEAVEDAGSVVATDAVLELDVARGVEVSEVHRARPQAQPADVDWESNTAVVPLPDLVEREGQQVTMKVHAPPADPGERTLVDVTLRAQGETATDAVTVEYTDDNAALAEHNESVSLDHRHTVVRTALGRGDVDTAQTELEKMTRVHGEDTDLVREAAEQTRLVKEGGRAERNSATKIVDTDRLGE